MKKLLCLCGFIGLTLPFVTQAAGPIDECYKNAQTSSAMRECLKLELYETRAEYRQVLEKVTAQASELDRVTGKRIAQPALDKANLSFDRYVADQCTFDEAMMGSGTGAGSANLSCQINLLRVRMGALETFLGQ